MGRLKTLPSKLQPLPAKLKPMTPGSWRAGKTSTQRGYGYRWQQERKAFLSANHLCVMCEAEGRVEPATVVDHKDPHRGDQDTFWDKTRWQPLCAHHHSATKQREEAAGIA